jgi:hypothetical protein
MKESNSALKLDYEVDDLLDKINEKGIESLTKREKLFLNRNSK